LYTRVVKLEPDICYQAIVSHDRRFDGVFFVGVGTTGIYCRTVCPARTPRRQSCMFYPSAAAAERAGYRPCLRCRPELAPGNARIDAVGRLAAAVADRIEDGALTELSVSALAEELGVTDRHLRRVVQSEFGVSPVELAQTARLLTAKRLLTDTDLPVTEVAFASGFSSLRRFNTLFRERYRLNPTGLRKTRGGTAGAGILVCEVAYRPPLDWEHLLRFIAGRASTGVEVVEGQRYLRTVRVGKVTGWMSVQPSAGRHALRVELASSLAPVILPVLTRVKRLFDLSADPQRIAEHLGPLAEAHPGMRVPGSFNGFETAVRAILGQQVSVKGASTLAGRITTAFGEPVETPHPGLTHLSPSPERLAAAATGEIASLGMPGARADAIRGMAQATVEGRISLEGRGDPEPMMERLRALPGIGEWTAQYLAMRALSWPDAFPDGDLGIRKALEQPDAREVRALAEQWRPWRSYAAMHLWRRLETQ
jgi:AraC family transcriptional regulator, regulatory protein of adaptative response / DNA-3-methyladenine glycosylase II